MTMMVNEAGYREARTKLESIISLDRVLPQNVFTLQTADVVLFADSWLSTDAGLSRLFAWASSSFPLTSYVIQPDPVEYYRKCYGAYPIVRLHTGTSAADYLSTMHAEVVGNKADSMFDRWEILAIFPDACDWAIYADRSLSLVILASLSGDFSTTLFKALNIDKVEQNTEIIDHLRRTQKSFDIAEFVSQFGL